jgi:hypothetical protein
MTLPLSLRALCAERADRALRADRADRTLALGRHLSPRTLIQSE